MVSQWRKTQWKHNLEAADALRNSREGGFADWEVAARFCAAMSPVDGRFERRGLKVPTIRYARRLMVEKHLPHLSEDYLRICTMSEAARYGEGYAMGDSERQEAQEVYGRASESIPWPTDA